MNSLLLEVAFSKITVIGIANDGRSMSSLASGFEIATQILLLLLEPSGTEYLSLVNPTSTGVKMKRCIHEGN